MWNINWKLFYLRSINPMIEKINPTIPIPIESSSIPDEQRVITIAKSNIAIPNPIFFTVNPSFENSYLLSSSLYFTAYQKDSIFYETCRLGTACNARCPQMASPQKGSWRQPAQGKRSVSCLIWSRPWLRKITALRRGAFGERNAPTSGWCIIAPLVN